MKILVTLVTFNRAEMLRVALKCIENQTYSDWHCYIIDNASTDHTQSVAESAPKEKFSYFRSDKNLGGAGGFSLATRLFLASDADGILMLDDDAEADPAMIENLVLAMKREHLDVANALVLNTEDPETLPFEFIIRNANEGARSHRVFTRKEAILHAKNGVISGNACFFNGTMIKRSVVEEIGFVDAKFFIWGDEINYRERIIRANKKIRVVADAIIRHPPMKERIIKVPLLGNVSVVQDNRAPIFYRNKGQACFFGRKWGDIPVWLAKIFLKYGLQGKFFLSIKLFLYFCDGLCNTYILSPKGSVLSEAVEKTARDLLAKQKSYL